MTNHSQTPAAPAKEAATDPAFEAAKRELELQKAMADLGKAQAEATLAARKVQFGEAPSSGLAGSVELKEKAGAIEAALLAAKALKKQAKDITDKLKTEGKIGKLAEAPSVVGKLAEAPSVVGKLPDPPSVLIYGAGEVPTLNALRAFRAQTLLVEQAFKNAQAASKTAEAPLPAEPRLAVALPAALAIGTLALDAVNKVFGFFRADYTVGGLDLSFEDSLLVHAFASAMLASEVDFRLPALYQGTELDKPPSVVQTALEDLGRYKAQAVEEVEHHKHECTRLCREAEGADPPKRKGDLETKAKEHKDAADAWKSALALFETFITKLTAVDDKGVVPLANVAREAVLFHWLSAGSKLLVVKLHKSGGSFYTKKTPLAVWNPLKFYVMGGAVISYVLLDGKTGRVLAADVVPVHGGFKKLDKVAKEVTIQVVASERRHSCRHDRGAGAGRQECRRSDTASTVQPE